MSTRMGCWYDISQSGQHVQIPENSLFQQLILLPVSAHSPTTVICKATKQSTQNIIQQWLTLMCDNLSGRGKRGMSWAHLILPEQWLYGSGTNQRAVPSTVRSFSKSLCLRNGVTSSKSSKSSPSAPFHQIESSWEMFFRVKRNEVDEGIDHLFRCRYFGWVVDGEFD